MTLEYIYNTDMNTHIGCRGGQRKIDDNKTPIDVVIKEAIEGKYKVIVKAGKDAAWYLKGQKHTYEELKDILLANKNNPAFIRKRNPNSYYCILINYH